LRATAYDLKVFFSVVGKEPVEVRRADVFAFLAEQRLFPEALSKYWTCITDWGVVRPHSRARSHATARWAVNRQKAPASYV